MRLCVLAAAAALSLIAGASQARAEIVSRTFTFPTVGISLDYGSFGYTPEGGEYTVLTGYNIVATHVLVDYVPGDGVDYTRLGIRMVVPVTDAPSEFLEILGTDLVETTPGVYHTEFETNDYNGIIRAGRYSLEIFSFNDDGDPVGTPGEFLENSGITFSVAIPEPASAALLLPAAGLLARRRR